MKKQQHVVPHGDRWAVQGAGTTKPVSIHKTQASAIAQAKKIATCQKATIVVHGRDGKIRDTITSPMRRQEIDYNVLELSSSNKITIPAAVREQLDLRKGDLLAVKVTRGVLVFKPIKKVNDSDYFHSKEWQEAESLVDIDILQGELTGPFENTDELLSALKS